MKKPSQHFKIKYKISWCWTQIWYRF